VYETLTQLLVYEIPRLFLVDDEIQRQFLVYGVW
jgi:hypothetical protein